MKNYGLQLRFPPDHQKKMASRPNIRPPASIFGDDNDDDDITKEFSCQSSKSRSLQMIDELQKKTLEEDPLAFDYDGVYDEMKSTAAHTRVQDRSKREPKYISAIIETAKKREREHDISYEKKLLKERTKDDHIYEDKEKFITSAYKQRLVERAKWVEEERLRGLCEEKDDVTKKTDLTDFYFSLNKNVAFGAQSAQTSKSTKEQSMSPHPNAEATLHTNLAREQANERSQAADFSEEFTGLASSSDPILMFPKDKMKATATTSDVDGKQASLEQSNIKKSFKEVSEDEKTVSKTDLERFKRSEDAIATARASFVARKKARVLL